MVNNKSIKEIREEEIKLNVEKEYKWFKWDIQSEMIFNLTYNFIDKDVQKAREEFADLIDEVYLNAIKELGKLDYNPDAMGVCNSFKLELIKQLRKNEGEK